MVDQVLRPSERNGVAATNGLATYATNEHCLSTFYCDIVLLRKLEIRSVLISFVWDNEEQRVREVAKIQLELAIEAYCLFIFK